MSGPGFDRKIYEARKKANTERYDRMWEDQKGRCFYCTWPMLDARLHAPKGGGTPDPLLATQEHKTPKSQLPRGQKWTAGNIVLACDTCNQKKKDHTPIEFENSHRAWLAVRRLEALTMRIGRIKGEDSRRSRLLDNMPDNILITSSA